MLARSFSGSRRNRPLSEHSQMTNVLIPCPDSAFKTSRSRSWLRPILLRQKSGRVVGIFDR